jgi:Arc/MetJ family transcription regulator
MRTNIDIDDKLMRQAMRATGAPTKKAAVEAALRKVVELKKQEGIKKLRGKVQWVGDLDAMREGRLMN